MARNFSRLLWEIANRFYDALIKNIKRLHCWMMENPKNSTPLEGINMILVGINGIVLSELIAPNTLIGLMNFSWAGIKFVIPIIIVVMGILVWGTKGVLETITDKKLEIPIKYKFSLLVLSIPFLIFINKFLAWIKIISKDYDKQNNPNN